MQTPEEQAKQIVENLHDGEYGVVFKATRAFKAPSDIESDLIIPAIAAALVAEGDRRAQEAREQALEDAVKIADAHIECGTTTRCPLRITAEIRTLKEGKDNGR